MPGRRAATMAGSGPRAPARRGSARAVRAAVLILSLVLLAGALGRFAAPLDALAVLRVPVAVATLGLAALLGGPWRMVAGLFAIAMLASWAGPRALPGVPGPITLYSKNVWFANDRLDALAGDIRASGADIVTLQEVSVTNSPLMARLEPDFPARHTCPFSTWGGLAVLSAWPATGAAPVCSARRGLAALQVASPDGPLWIVSIHLRWPWPARDGWALSRELAREIDALEGPKIVAGDFNTMPWAFATRSIARAAGGRVVGPHRASLVIDARGWLVRGDVTTGLRQARAGFGHVPVPIDHVVAAGGRVETRPRFGSDHLGLVARVAPAP